MVVFPHPNVSLGTRVPFHQVPQGPDNLSTTAPHLEVGACHRVLTPRTDAGKNAMSTPSDLYKIDTLNERITNGISKMTNFCLNSGSVPELTFKFQNG